MAHLTLNSLQKIQHCICDIYSNMDIKSMSAHIVSIVSKIISSDIILYAKYSDSKIVENQKAVYVEDRVSIGEFQQMDAFVRHAHEHPFINFMHFQKSKPHPFREDIERRLRNSKQPPALTAVKISDVLKDRQFHSLALFNEFFRPNRIRYQLGIPVSCGEGFHTAVCFNRDKMDFSEDDRLTLNLIGPHIVQAYRNAESHAKARDVSGVFERLSEDKNCGLLKSLGLSFREAEVLYWAAQGKTNYEIAMILNIAPGTVKIHLEKIYRKLGVENRMAAAMIAVKTLCVTEKL